MFLGLLLRIFMDDAILWKQNIHTALSVISRHIPFCFLSLILAVSATKWLDCLGLQGIATLQSPFHLGRPGLCAGLVCRKVTRYAFLNAQGRSAPVVSNSSISQAEDTRVCVSVSSKLLLGPVIDVFLIVE